MKRNVTFVEKDSQKCLLKIKIIEKFETIAILQVNTEVQHTVYVMQDLMCLTKSLFKLLIPLHNKRITKQV